MDIKITPKFVRKGKMNIIITLKFWQFKKLLFNSVAQLCPTLCNPMACSTPGFLSITNSWSLLKLMSIESMMPSNHLLLCHPLLLPSIFPSFSCYYFFLGHWLWTHLGPYWSFPWLSLSNVAKLILTFPSGRPVLWLWSQREWTVEHESTCNVKYFWKLHWVLSPRSSKENWSEPHCSVWFRQVECGPKRTTVPLGCVRESGTRRSVRFCLVGWPSNPTVVPEFLCLL